MNKPHSVAVLVGSLRRDSINRKIAEALIELAPSTLKFSLVEIGGLSLYNPDDEAYPHVAWTKFRDKIKAVDAVLFVTPEYNRSVPASLKNALDVGSRPLVKNVWNDKPSAVISASPGAIGGFGANHHLRQSLVALNAPTMAAPEIYVGGADKLFNESGKLVNDDMRKRLQQFMQAFNDWIAANVKSQAALLETAA
jgi:chromate reductase